MNFVDRFTTNLRLTGASFKMLFQAPGVLALPLGTLLWTAIWAAGPISFFLWLGENHTDAFISFWKGLFFITVNAWEAGNYGLAITSAIIEGYILYAIWLSIVGTGVLYFLTAGMHVGTQQIKRHGVAPSIGAGLRVANKNLGRIFLMALFNATVFAWIRYAVRWGLGMITFPILMVPVLGTWARRIILGGASFLLTAVSYLMLPIVIYERQGAMSAMKSAWKNVKETWTGIALGSTFLWVALFFLMQFVAQPLARVAFSGEPTVGIIFAVITGAIVYAFASAAGANMRATLYWYATTGEVPEGFNADDLPEIVRDQQQTISGNPYSV